MQKTNRFEQGVYERLEHRLDFVKEAVPEEQRLRFLDMLETDDAFEQEIHWGEWTESFFEKGKINWTAFAAVPMMQYLSLTSNWYDPRPVWEFLLYMATQVEHLYFYYDKHPGPDFSSEEIRWKGVGRREEVRPWLRLAFHAYREFVPLLDSRLEQAGKGEKEILFKLLWVSISFGRTKLRASTQVALQHWACTFQKEQKQGFTIPNHNQLGLFKA